MIKNEENLQAFQKIAQTILERPHNFSAVLGFENNWHHNEWYDYLLDQNNKRICILAPREHAKSTVFTVMYSLWEMVRNHNIRIIIVSNTATQSEQFLGQIQNIISSNDLFIKLFGNLKPARAEAMGAWNSSTIVIKRDTIEKDPTVVALGTGGAILSKRADIIICDDILNKENTRTPDQRAKVKEWFNDILVPVLVRGGRLIWVATAFKLEDLSHELLKNPIYDVKKVYKMILQDADNKELWDEYMTIIRSNPDTGYTTAQDFYKTHKEEMDKGGETLWNRLYSYKDAIDKKLEVGTRSFNLMYQNNAVSDETAVIKESWIEQCKDESRTLLTTFDQSTYDKSIHVIVQGVDLAISESELANETVDITLGSTSDGKIILLNGIGGRWSPKEIRETIKGQNDRFKPSIILVENNAFQASMVRDLQDTSNAPIKGFQTTGEKFDEFVGINSIAVALENKQIILPANPRDPHTMAIYESLKADMLAFPSGHTGDYLMAFWFAFTALRGLGAGQVRAVKSSGLRKSIV